MNLEEIKKAHQTGILGILHVYNRRRLLRSIPFKAAFVLSSVITAFICYFFPAKIVGLIKILAELNIAILPSLLGFTLGGYALIIGFSSSNTLKDFTMPAPNENGSFFQLLVAIFSINIIQQFAALILSIIISFCLNINYDPITFHYLNKNPVILNGHLGLTVVLVNLSSLWWLLFLSLWALLTIPYVVTNLFNFAQINHSIGTTNRILEEISADIENVPLEDSSDSDNG